MPKASIPISICNHRFGAKATLTQETDRYMIATAITMEMIGFKHNITPTFFLTGSDSASLINDVVPTKRCGWGIYYSTSNWYYDSGVRQIPDFTKNVWTSLGANAFKNAVEGQSKPLNYPNHGQQLYDISDGVFGYDYNTNSVGTNQLNEVYGTATDAISKFVNQVGVLPSVISYATGLDFIGDFLTDYFIAGRNSQYTMPTAGDGRTAYGYDKNTNQYLGYPNIPFSRKDRISQPCTTRFGTFAGYSAFVTDQITKTINNGGWYNDFVHYSTADMNEMNLFYELIDSVIGSNFVWRCGYDEAMEYLFLKEGIQRIVAISKEDYVQCFLYVNESLNVCYPKINTNISFEINLASTFLSGKFIKTNAGKIKSLGNNKYIIDVKLENLSDGIYSVKLSEADSDIEYLNFNLPVATKTISGNILTIDTDIPTRAVLFNQIDSTPFNYRAFQRKNDLNLNHSFEITGLTNVKIGLITEVSQSILVDVL